MKDIEAFKLLVNKIIEIINKKKVNDTNILTKIFDLDKDKKLIYYTFIGLTDPDVALKFKLSTSNYLNYRDEDWVFLLKRVKLGHFTFLEKSAATLKTIYNLLDDSDNDNKDKEELLYAFKNVTLTIRRKKNLLDFIKNINKKSLNILENQEKLDDIILNITNYKDPSFLAKIIDSITDNEFRMDLLNTIKAKGNIDIYNILGLNEENYTSQNENKDENNPMTVLIEIFDFIMKIKIKGEIKAQEQITNIVFNYIKDLFNSSEVLNSISEEIDNEYKLISSNKNIYKKHIYRKTSTIKTFQNMDNIYTNNFKSGFEDIDWEKIYNSPKVYYRSSELKIHILHIILRSFELLINMNRNGEFHNIKNSVNITFNELINNIPKGEQQIFNDLFSTFTAFKNAQAVPLLESIIDDIINNKEDVQKILKHNKQHIKIDYIICKLPINLSKETIDYINNMIVSIIEDIINSIVNFDGKNKSIHKIKKIAKIIDNFIIQRLNNFSLSKKIKQRVTIIKQK